MPQVFQLVSGPLIQQLLKARNNAIGKALEAEKDDAKVVDKLFRNVLSRPPNAAELDRCAGYLAAASPPRTSCGRCKWSRA